MGVFSDLKPKNHAQRNGFDLSRRSVFSAKVGQIKPVLALPTLPSSEYEIDLKQLLRTQPLQTAAFSGFGINYDFVFVPYNQLYSSFNQFIAQRENKQLTSQPNNVTIPTFNGYFVQFVVSHAVWDYLMASFGPYEACLEKWIELGSNFQQPQTFDLSVLPYCQIYATHTPWQSLLLSNVTALDMYGYGNYLPIIKVLSEYVKSNLLDGTDETLDEQTRCYSKLLSYLSDESIDGVPFRTYKEMINYLLVQAEDQFTDYYGFEPRSSVMSNTVQPSLWPVMAYQKAFHEYYRNVYYDDSVSCFGLFGATGYDLVEFNDSVSFPYVKLFNFDDFEQVGELTNSTWFDDSELLYRYLLMFNLYPHLYKKDLVTGVLPSTQFGDVSTMITDDNFRQLISKFDATATGGKALNVSNSVIGSVETPVYVNHGSAVGNTLFKFSPALAISVLESRRADAMQRFKERMLRAGDKVKDIFVSHGWSEPRSESSYEPIFLGSFDGRLDINTVAATAESANWEVGQLGANGVASVQGSKIRFKSSDFGVILAVMYVLKDSEYDAYQLERAWQLVEPFDFPYPELQNISLQPVTLSQVNNVSNIQGALSLNLPTTDVIGYLPSFMEYKTSLDRVHDEFYSARPFYFNPTKQFVDNSVWLNNFKPGVFSDWVTPRQDCIDVKSKSYLYQQADVADNIFMLSSTANSESSPFLVNCYFDIKAVQPLSVIGLPI